MAVGVLCIMGFFLEWWGKGEKNKKLTTWIPKFLSEMPSGTRAGTNSHLSVVPTPAVLVVVVVVVCGNDKGGCGCSDGDNDVEL